MAAKLNLRPPQMQISFVVSGEPVSKARARVANGHAFTPERTKIAENAVLVEFLKARRNWRPEPDEVFDVDCYFHCGTHQRRDIDNMAKLVLDALNGHAWSDDHLVVGLSARKLQVPRAEARTSVYITRLPS